MSPVEEAIVRRKLAIIVENLKALEPIAGISRVDYLGDIYKRKATERLLQELIEAAIDVNTHLIVQSGQAVPDDYYESFILAGQLKFISVDLSIKLAPSAGLRNRLVHAYDRLEHSMVLDVVKLAEDLYAEYVRQIEEYLSSAELKKGKNG